MYFLGVDIGSSSIKLSVLDTEKGKSICEVKLPENELIIYAPNFGWAEQDPNIWWKNVKQGIHNIGTKIDLKKIKGIGIAYQMHGLVLTDEKINPVRTSIIWCDSRAVDIGAEAYNAIGAEICQNQILGSPGNFTVSKLKWVKENEPEVYKKASFMMLPGDFIAAKLSGVAQISISGLSEAALWDFPKGVVAKNVLDHMGISENLIPEIVPNFGHQATVCSEIAEELGFAKGVRITYRSGDQPNNAFSLNVLKKGEIATTAGTSAVMYAISEDHVNDPQNRINTFLHVNNSEEQKCNGVMLCINGAGITYQWLRKILLVGKTNKIAYEKLNIEASKVSPGSDDLRFYPFGNGVERIFNNKKVNSGLENLNFNIHNTSHVIRSASEGIVFAMNYGFDIMKSLGTSGEIVRAGKENLFLSPVFREIFTNTTQTTLELYNTSGSEGAARGAAFGYGCYSGFDEAFDNLKCLERIEPLASLTSQYQEIYEKWKENIKISQQ